MNTETETFTPVEGLSLAALDVGPTNFDWSEGFTETWDFIRVGTCGWCSEPLADWQDEWVDVTDHDDTEARQGDDGKWEITSLPNALDPEALLADGDLEVLDNGRLEVRVKVPENKCVNPECSEFCDSEQDPFESEEGPMMSYYYPLPDTQRYDRDDAVKLVHLPLCIVWFEPEAHQDSDAWHGMFGGRGTYALALTGGGMDLSWEICEGFMRLGFLPPVKYAADLPKLAGKKHSPRNDWIIAGCRRALAEQLQHEILYLERGLKRLDSLLED